MQVKCVGTLEVRKSGDSVRCYGTSILPKAGFPFSFEADSGVMPTTGVYEVEGVAEVRSYTKGDKSGSFVIVRGTAVPAQLSVKKV